jgi:formate dehydrogenase subunit delta
MSVPTTRPDIVRMANHIARQFDHLPPAQARAALANHLNSFWDPAMRRDLLREVAAEPSMLHPTVLQVAEDLRR